MNMPVLEVGHVSEHDERRRNNPTRPCFTLGLVSEHRVGKSVEFAR